MPKTGDAVGFAKARVLWALVASLATGCDRQSVEDGGTGGTAVADAGSAPPGGPPLACDATACGAEWTPVRPSFESDVNVDSLGGPDGYRNGQPCTVSEVEPRDVAGQVEIGLICPGAREHNTWLRLGSKVSRARLTPGSTVTIERERVANEVADFEHLVIHDDAGALYARWRGSVASAGQVVVEFDDLTFGVAECGCGDDGYAVTRDGRVSAWALAVQQGAEHIAQVGSNSFRQLDVDPSLTIGANRVHRWLEPCTGCGCEEDGGGTCEDFEPHPAVGWFEIHVDVARTE